MRRASQLDGPHKAIVQALRACGCSVQSLATVGSGCPDLLVGHRTPQTGLGVTYLLEVKSGDKPHSNPRTVEAQRLWYARWKGGPLHVVRSVSEALAVLGFKPGGEK